MWWKAAVAALLAMIGGATWVRADCYVVFNDGTKMKVPQSKCDSASSPGTPDFEMAADRRLAGVDACTAKLVDGTSLAMRGLPRITNGQLTYTDEQNRLVALPLREIVALDSGKRYPCTACARDAQGHLVARPEARAAFVAAHPCPAPGGTADACKGFVVDHVTPLVCGGQDVPENMQWATEGHAKVKAQWAQRACAG